MKIESIKRDHAIYKKALELRYELFFKGHDLPFNVLFDEKENASYHVAAFSDDDLIAYGRLSNLGRGEFQVSQLVVSPDFQRKGYGSQVLIKLMQLAEVKGAKSISLNARVSATGIYTKQGFKSVGATFKSKTTGIPHIQMVYHANT